MQVNVLQIRVFYASVCMCIFHITTSGYVTGLFNAKSSFQILFISFKCNVFRQNFLIKRELICLRIIKRLYA